MAARAHAAHAPPRKTTTTYAETKTKKVHCTRKKTLWHLGKMGLCFPPTPFFRFLLSFRSLRRLFFSASDVFRNNGPHPRSFFCLPYIPPPSIDGFDSLVDNRLDLMDPAQTTASAPSPTKRPYKSDQAPLSRNPSLLDPIRPVRRHRPATAGGFVAQSTTHLCCPEPERGCHRRGRESGHCAQEAARAAPNGPGGIVQHRPWGPASVWSDGRGRVARCWGRREPLPGRCRSLAFLRGCVGPVPLADPEAGRRGDRLRSKTRGGRRGQRRRQANLDISKRPHPLLPGRGGRGRRVGVARGGVRQLLPGVCGGSPAPRRARGRLSKK